MKVTIDAERSRLQSQLRDMEQEMLQLQKQLRFTQDELQKSHQSNTQAQNDEKELQARLTNETEERERLQLQLHQVKKQVNYKADYRNRDMCIFIQQQFVNSWETWKIVWK